MKKNVRLDTKGFLLMETLLVSLTIAGILLYMYVQYSRITDSYHRMSRYNSVEKIYRTGNIKRFLLAEDDSFFEKVNTGNRTTSGKTVPGIYQVGESDFPSYGSSTLLDNLECRSIYIVRGKAKLENVDSSFGPFLKTLSQDVDDNTYQIVVQYDDGDFAAITLRED